jgi:hypothetical protein
MQLINNKGSSGNFPQEGKNKIIRETAWIF